MKNQADTNRIHYKVALFVGSDIFSQLLMNLVVPKLTEEGFQPYIFLTKHKAGKSLHPEIRHLEFFERNLLPLIIYPFLDEHPVHNNSKCLSPKLLSQKYNVTVMSIDNVNDPNFIQEMRCLNITTGIIIRSYQKFGQEIITFFENNSTPMLWNLHPGILPFYRGVMTFFRSMANQEKEIGLSLHVVDSGWDSGPIIDIIKTPLNLSDDMLTNYCNTSVLGVEIITKNLIKLRDQNEVQGYQQNSNTKRYYSFPNNSEIEDFKKKGNVLVNEEQIKRSILENFSLAKTNHWNMLSEAIDNAIKKVLHKKSPSY